MENKYYTPSIEEFFVGFEYEELEFIPVKDSHFGIKIKKNVFVEHIWKTGYSNWQFLDNLKEGKIRVKYLDSSDIEELGFKKIIKDQYYYDEWINPITLLIDDDMFVQIINKCNGTEYYLFQGTIKNKSELKKVLNMLNIK